MLSFIFIFSLSLSLRFVVIEILTLSPTIPYDTKRNNNSISQPTEEEKTKIKIWTKGNEHLLSKEEEEKNMYMSK